MNTSKKSSDCQTVAYYSVYVLWCRETNMHYVGVTRQEVKLRIRQHKKGKKQFIDCEIHRIGWEGNFDYWIVEENVPADQISDCEQKWVKFFDCHYPKGYNKTCGGISNLTVSDDTREILRQKALERDVSGENNPHYGKKHTDEAKEEMRQARLGKPAWNKGVPCREETKALMREKALERNVSGENNPFFGKKHTEESKEKNRQKQLGRIPWNKGKKMTEEQKAIMREKGRATRAAKRAAKAAAEENRAAAYTAPTNLSDLLDAVIL